MWLPDGIHNLAGRARKPEHEWWTGVAAHKLLQAEGELLQKTVEAFFRDPIGGRMGAKYHSSNGCLKGVGDAVPKAKELETDHDWRVYTQCCIGMTLIGMFQDGAMDRAYVADLFFTALANTANNPTGKWLGNLIDWVYDDDELIAIARRELGHLLGIDESAGGPSLTLVSRYMSAMPQYTMGHLDRVALIRDAIASQVGLEVAGNAYEGVGIPDCIHAGEQAAERVIQQIT